LNISKGEEEDPSIIAVFSFDPELKTSSKMKSQHFHCFKKARKCDKTRKEKNSDKRMWPSDTF